MPTPLPRPGPTDYQDAPGTELDLVWDELCDVVEATEATANAALPATQAAAGTLIAAAADKATPVDADSLALSDSAAGGILRRFSWASLKEALNGVFARLAGVSGGQTLIGGTASGENLTLRSTVHATKGAIILGAASEYDEANNRLGIGTLTPSANVHSMATTEQLRLGYDASNYLSALVSSTGLISLSGTLGQYQFSGPTDASAQAARGGELITNATFQSDLSGWTAGAGWSWLAGGAKHTAGSTATLQQDESVTNGTSYQIDLVISGRTAGSIAVALGSVSAIDSGASTAFTASFSRTVVAGASGTVPLVVTPTTDFDGTIDSVSLKAVTLGSFPAVAQLMESGSPAIEIRQSLARNNVSIGVNSGRSITSGSANNNFGRDAGYSITTGSSNSNFGHNAGRSCSNGSTNNNFGRDAGYSITAGSSNNNFGNLAGYAITTGSFNCIFGNAAGTAITTASSNSFFGGSAGRGVISGSLNSGFGSNAGRYLADGSTQLTAPTNCVYIGGSTKASADSVTNENVFGYNATGIGSNSCVLGSSAVTKCQIFGDIILDKTVTAGGTTGAQTINKTVGSVNFAAAGASLVVTNNRVTTASIIVATVATADATMKSVVAVAAAGSFTLTANAAATAQTRVNWIVIN
jgi:hypothetical protein